MLLIAGSEGPPLISLAVPHLLCNRCVRGTRSDSISRKLQSVCARVSVAPALVLSAAEGSRRLLAFFPDPQDCRPFLRNDEQDADVTSARCQVLVGQALLPVHVCYDDADLDRQECLSYP